MDARKFPPPPPPRQNFKAQQNDEIGNENINDNMAEEKTSTAIEKTGSVKEKKPMSKELKTALFLSGATASFLVAIVFIVLLFVL